MGHEIIAQKASKADLGIISYPLNGANKDKLPTKLFEYIAWNLPIIATQNTTWDTLIDTFNAGIPIDFEEPDLGHILDRLKQPFYTHTSPELLKSVLWDKEKKLLIDLMENI